LSAIVGWADVLQRGVSDEETVRHGLAAISRNARMQGQLVEDLLDMSRMEAGKLRMELHPVELGAVVAAAVDACLPSATQKEVGLRTAFGCSGSVVMADAGRLQQVVCSLLNNAIKFSTPGDQIDIRLSQEESLACITVCDSGQGIEPAFLPRVFDRFQQQDGSKTRRHGGLGLGLAIVRQLVQLHGGQVQVHSAGVGLGASFTVSLPLLHTVAVPGDLVEGSPAASGAAVYDMLNRLEGLHVLLVDDEFDTREITGQLLGRAGAQVTLAASAVAAWKAVDEHLPDVIVSDIGMPGIDGYEFMRGLRQRPAERGGNTPALAFTAYAREEDREAALAAGFHSHLSKPAMQGELVEALAALMKTV
jgi:CheY-like chemotaxis protein/two-component sensor histidine kinase